MFYFVVVDVDGVIEAIVNNSENSRELLDNASIGKEVLSKYLEDEGIHVAKKATKVNLIDRILRKWNPVAVCHITFWYSETSP